VLIAKRNNWTREELIVAFNLYCKIPFSKITSRNPGVVELASLIRRTPSAVALKLVNYAHLDPVLQKRSISGMSHGSKGEQEIWDEFHNNWEELAFESEKIIASLKEIPVEYIAQINSSDLPREGKERDAIVKARVNQNFFRASVLASYGNKCCITGIPLTELLVASHIVPWSVDKINRINPANGLCLNMLHDKAFDSGFITITTDFKVHLSKVLFRNKGEESIKRYFAPYDGVSIKLPQKFLPDKAFLEYHNINIFRNE
jgi:putative restriction endonuclease